MVTKKTSKLDLPLTMADVLFELETEEKQLSKVLGGIFKDIEASLEKSFFEAGGCKTCRGRGWHVVWDTLDCMDGSCAEYESCKEPGCTEESRARTGMHPHRSKYDARRGVVDPIFSSAVYKAVAWPIVSQLNELTEAIRGIERCRRDFRKGDRVVVVKGRKVPVGTSGRVAWVSANTGGILVKDEDKWQDREADGIWVNPQNLEKIAE